MRIVDGAEVWRHDVDAEVSTLSAIDDWVVYANHNKQLVGLSLQFGTPQWVLPTTGIVKTSIANKGSRVFFGDDAGYLYCYDLKSHVDASTWLQQTVKPITAGIAIAGRWIICGHDDGSFSKIDDVGHETQLKNYPPAAQFKGIASVTLIVIPELMHVIVLDAEYNLHCRDINDGSYIWSSIVRYAMPIAPVLLRGQLFVSNERGVVTIVNSNSGEIIRVVEIGGLGKIYAAGQQPDTVFVIEESGYVEALIPR